MSDPSATPQSASDPRGLEVVTADAEATRELGRALAAAALPGVAEGGCVVALSGDLGAGKTVFVKGVGDGVGIAADAVVVSPTFTIARSLAFSGPPAGMLHHVDAYRLGGGEELDLVGFEDMWGRGTFTCVEWAERVAEALPEDRISVSIEAMEAAPGWTGEGEAPGHPRRVRFDAEGSRSRALLQSFGAALQGGGSTEGS